MTKQNDYKRIGKLLLNRLEVEQSRLGEALSELNEIVIDCLQHDRCEEAFQCCKLALALCTGLRPERVAKINLEASYAQGIFHAYMGTSYLNQGKLELAIDCYRKSRTLFHGKLREEWNEGLLLITIGKLYQSTGKLEKAFLAFQESLSSFQAVTSTSKDRSELVKEARTELKKTGELLRNSLQSKSKKQKKTSKATPLLRLIPLCGGDAAAGKPLTIRDNIEGYISSTEFEIGDETFTLEIIQGTGNDPHVGSINFAVKVKGNSMEPVIQNGEYVLVRRQDGVDNGTIAVVRFRKDVGSEETEVTVKEYYQEKDHLLLQPKNEDAEWFVIVEKDEDENTVKARYQKQIQAGKLEIFIDPDPQIEGKVIGILKCKEVE